MRHLFAFVCAVALALGSVLPAAAQNQAFDAQFGATPWAQNNVRTASAYNWIIDNSNGQYLNFTFPSVVCTQALSFGGRGSVNPFTSPVATGLGTTTPNITVSFNDATAANNETVALNAVATVSGGFCTLSIANLNTHLAYKLSSGTCGLQEAVNDASANGGQVVEYTQESVALGCKAGAAGVANSTITGVKATSNVYVHDISNGQNTWYALKPTATTNIAAAAAPTVATVAGGTFTNGNVITCVSYVDLLGGESTCQTNETTTATGGTTNGLTVTSPAATAGAVGYRVYMTAVGGSSGAEVLHTTLTNCAQSALVTVFPTCAIGATSTILAPITSTSKVPPVPTAHTLIAFQPVNTLPSFSPGSPVGNTQLFALSNAAISVGSGTNADLAEIVVPAGYFNSLGKSWMVCAKLATATQVATAVITVKLNLIATNRQQSAVAVTTLTFATQTQAAAGTIQGCAKWTTAVTGSSGTIMSSTPFGPWTNTLNSTPSQTVSATVDVSAAASSAVDLTKQTYLSLNFAAATANTTGSAVLDLTVTPLPGQ